jgi:cyanate permease
MRPLAVLNSIILGSATAITFGLGGVLIVFLVLKGDHPQMSSEFPALVRSSMLFGLLAAASGLSLLGMLRRSRWRWLAHAAMWLVLAGIATFYWPR